jgi:hypothetical protein
MKDSKNNNVDEIIIENYKYLILNGRLIPIMTEEGDHEVADENIFPI